MEIACPFGCASKFTRENFPTHKQECEKKPISCPQCDIIYPSEQIEVCHSLGPVIAVGACGPTGETLRRPQRGPSGNTGNVKLKINSIEY